MTDDAGREEPRELAEIRRDLVDATLDLYEKSAGGEPDAQLVAAADLLDDIVGELLDAQRRARTT